jgi:hypothetical protein
MTSSASDSMTRPANNIFLTTSTAANKFRFRHGQHHAFLHPTEDEDDSINRNIVSPLTRRRFSRAESYSESLGNDATNRAVGSIPQDTRLDVVPKLCNLTDVIHQTTQPLHIQRCRSYHEPSQLQRMRTTKGSFVDIVVIPQTLCEKFN